MINHITVKKKKEWTNSSPPKTKDNSANSLNSNSSNNSSSSSSGSNSLSKCNTWRTQACTPVSQCTRTYLHLGYR